jgi:hypothetical protein
LLQESQEGAHGGIGAAAFRPKRGNVVPFDGELGQHRHQLSTRYVGRRNNGRADVDSAAAARVATALLTSTTMPDGGTISIVLSPIRKGQRKA